MKIRRVDVTENVEMPSKKNQKKERSNYIYGQANNKPLFIQNKASTISPNQH